MIDFHCHLDLYPDPATAAAEAARSGAYVLSVTTTPKAWIGTSKLTKGLPRVRTALGLHPQIAHERYTEVGLFEAILPEAPYVGEVGLDGTPGHREHHAFQSRVFDSILKACVRSGGRVMSIHSRRATGQVLEALHDNPDAGLPVLHWFSGTMGELRRAADQGCWFSVGPAMLGGARGRAIVASMPRDRLLTETDGPFGSDRGHVLRPGDVGAVHVFLANAWSMPEAECAEVVRRNFRSVAATASGSTHAGGLAPAH